MNQGRSFLDKYKVPKKKNPDELEILSENSDLRKYLIEKIVESFKKPESSESCMKFHRSWSINLSESTSTYIKKRSNMKATNKTFIESIGFLYLKNESQLKDIVKIGKLKIGNNPESHFGNSKMGISLSQHADICHSSFFQSGIILLIKYVKGKVNYLPFEENNSADLDPKFDCHINKDKLSNDPSITTNLAFQSTQVIVYEYNEDIDFLNYPSQVLCIGAVEVSWEGRPLFRDLYRKDNILWNNNNNNNNVSKIVFKLKSNKRHIDAHSETPPTKRSHLSIPNSIIQPTTINSNIVEREMFSPTLILGKSFSSDSTLNLNISLISRLTEKIVISNILIKNWNLLGMLPNKIFENYLSYDENNVEKHVNFSSSVINSLPGKINVRKKLGATFRPKYALHFTMNPVSYKDKKLMLKVIEQLKSRNTVGVVRCTTLCNILCYVFPSGPISQFTGVSSLDAKCNLHVVIFTEQHPQFLPCNYTPQDKNLKKEQKLFQDVLSEYEGKSVPKSVILMDILRNSIQSHKNKLCNEQSNKISKFSSASRNSSETKNDDSDMEIDSNCGSDFDSSSCFKSKNNSVALINSKDTTSLSNKTHGIEQLTSQPNYLSNQTLPQPHNFIESNSNSSMLYPFDNSVQSLPVTVLSNGTSTSPPLSGQISNLPIIYQGRFKLVISPKLQRDRNECCPRRPIYLDSSIFEMTSDYNHVSIYKGGF